VSAVTTLDAALAARRAAYPILSRQVHGHPLAYLDHAASGQVAEVVIERMARYHREQHANVHRGVHSLSQEATAAYEGAREAVAAFVKAPSVRGVVFTRGTTEAINLVAQSWGRSQVQAGDELLLTELEHHANIVPWQLLAEAVGAKLVVAPILDDGRLDLEAYRALLGPRTRLVALTHASNALGVVNPVAELVQEAKAHGATVLVDGAQAVAHMPVDVQALGCDFYAFSGHKLGGPTGIGVLVAKPEVLQAMPPWQGGGAT
jgi:selenocysteine lyase/cysteine desulfurase